MLKISDVIALIQSYTHKLKTDLNSKQDAPSATGTAGQVLALDSNLKPVWTDQGGGGSTADCVKKNGTDEVTAKNLQIVQKTYSPNLYNTETITDGIYLNPANGSENENSGYLTTDYIPVEAGEKYYGTWQWKLDPTRRDMMLNFVTCYNESKEVMGSVGMTSPSNPITIPTGVAYIRISQSNQDYYEYRQFEKGTAGTHYYPYGEILDEVIKDQYMPEVSMRQIPAFELVDGLNLFNSNDPDYEPGKFLTTNGSVSDNSSYATSGYIKVEPGDYIVFAYYIPQFDINNVASMRTIACYDADKNNLSTKGIYSSNTFDVPSGVSYVRICWHSGTYGTNVQIQKVAPYESFYPQYKTYEEPHYELKRDYMYGMPGKPEHVFLPSEIYVAVGRTIELYNEQIVLDHEKYHFVWICGEGYAYKRKFSITGSTVGNKSLTLELYDDKKNLCWRGVCTIHVVSASNPSVKILPIGDSLTNWKAWLQETMLLSSQSVEFVGTRFSGESVDSEGNVYARGTIHSEGRSGFSAGNYLADTSYTFDDRYDGIGTVSGTANPFWDGSKFSLNHYLTTQTGVPTPDAVQLFLGTNDLTNGVDAAIDNIVAIVTSIRSEYSTLPIFVCNTIFRSNQNGYGSAGNDAYVGGGGAGAWQYEQDTRVMDLMVGLRKRLADVTGITFIPLASCMDREYGFGQVLTKVNPRCAVEVPMPEESVHPVASGYYQMADLMYSTYCGVLS